MVGAEPGEDAGDVAGVVLELAEAVTQVGFFGADDGKIDGEEQDDHDGRDPEAARGDGESEGDDEGSEIERVARVGVGAGGGELLVLVDVSGGEGADEDAGSGEEEAGGDRGPGRMREVEVDDGEKESERHADAAGDAGPSGGRGGSGRGSGDGIAGGIRHAAPSNSRAAAATWAGWMASESFVGLGTAPMAGDAVGTAQDDAGRAERAVARGIRWTEDSDDRNVQGGGEMHGAGVSANEKSGAAGERDELGDGTGDCLRGLVAGRFDSTGQVFFAGTEVDERLESEVGEFAGDFAVALGRPLLGAPSGAGIEDGEGCDAFQNFFDLLLGGGVARKFNVGN